MKIDTNTLILSLNFLLYLYWFSKNYIKYKRITPYSFLIIWYAIIALMAVVTYFNGVYISLYMSSTTTPPTIQPLGLILSFILFYILIYPFKRLNYFKIQDIYITKQLFYIELIVIALFLLNCIVLIPYTLIALKLDAADIYNNAREESNFLLPQYIAIFTRFTTILYLIFLPYSFYQIRSKINLKYILLIITIVLIMIQTGIIYSSRGNLFMSIGTLIFIFILFQHKLSKKVKRAFFISGIIILLIFTSYSIIITTSRYQYNDSTESIQAYFGESFNNFSLRLWNENNIKLTYGEMYFPHIYSFLTGTTLKDFSSTQARIDYFEIATNTPVINNFTPIYGKLLIEFGYFLPFVFILILSYFLDNFLKKNPFPFYRFPLLIFLFQKLYFYSIFGFLFRDSMFIDLFFVIFLSIIIKTFMPHKYLMPQKY